MLHTSFNILTIINNLELKERKKKESIKYYEKWALAKEL